MRNDKFLKYICMILVAVLLLPSVKAVAADAPVLSDWDKEFDGTGSPHITFRSYLILYVYPDKETYERNPGDETSALATIELTKITSDSKSKIQGVYVLKYKGENLITYDNCGDTCKMTFCEGAYTKLYQMFYNDRDIGGRESYFLYAKPYIRVYARGNKKGPYPDSSGRCWYGLDDIERANFTVDTDAVPGGTSGNGSILKGEKTLNADQIANIYWIYDTAWTSEVSAKGMDIQIDYEANTGAFSDKKTKITQTAQAYEGYCIDEEPTKNHRSSRCSLSGLH